VTHSSLEAYLPSTQPSQQPLEVCQQVFEGFRPLIESIGLVFDGLHAAIRAYLILQHPETESHCLNLTGS